MGYSPELCGDDVGIARVAPPGDGMFFGHAIDREARVAQFGDATGQRGAGHIKVQHGLTGRNVPGVLDVVGNSKEGNHTGTRPACRRHGA